ncbi:hypothetical protein [Paenibacillus sp. FJAT-26967]|uniref:hypothetical protein n=1 Tax=Paenibacillus sp. FJAT-26967 TaxID=1729690 RepID=UPI000A3E6540|nr:hypothetical protein [Paenibacillus sp. FJAT-26967]
MFWRKLYRAESGTVSIYLILIIVPIFFIQAVLIDYARVKAAEREAATAARAAIRSVLSAYDQELAAYGLFGLTGETNESSELFHHIFKQNLSGASTGAFYKLLDTRPEPNGDTLAPLYTLANHTVFEGQVLDTMKYQAPIEFALEIADKLQKPGAAKTMANGALYAKEAEKLERLLNKREEAMDKAWKEVEALIKKIRSRYSSYQARITELNRLAELIGLNTAEDVAGRIKNLEVQISSLSASMTDLNRTIAGASMAGPEAAGAIQGMMESLNSMQMRMNELTTDLSKWKELLDNILKYAALVAVIRAEVVDDDEWAQNMQKDIQEQLLEAKKANDELNTELKRLSTGQADELKAFEAFKSIKIISEDEFRLYQTGIGTGVALFSGFRNKIETINVYSNNQADAARAANEAYFAKMEETYQRQQQIETERSIHNAGVRQEKEKQRGKIQAALDKAKQAMGSCSKDQEAGLIVAPYEKLERGSNGGLYAKYMSLNAVDPTTGTSSTFTLEGKPDDEIQHSMSLLGKLGQLSEGIRNEVFINEYAVSQFNYRTFGTEKDNGGQLKPIHALSEPAAHKLPKQEVEYLLYGFDSCMKNISAAYGEMFAFRFAVHMVEELMDPKKEMLNAGSPLLVLLTAAAEAGVQALEDMNELTEGKAVPITSKLTPSLFTFTYKDYLRVFLLLHSNDKRLMARMQSLIEINTDKPLDKAVTYVQGTANSSVSLWFLPGLMKLVNGTGVSSCEVSGNRCTFRSQVDLAY